MGECDAVGVVILMTRRDFPVISKMARSISPGEAVSVNVMWIPAASPEVALLIVELITRAASFPVAATISCPALASCRLRRSANVTLRFAGVPAGSLTVTIRSSVVGDKSAVKLLISVSCPKAAAPPGS